MLGGRVVSWRRTRVLFQDATSACNPVAAKEKQADGSQRGTQDTCPFLRSKSASDHSEEERCRDRHRREGRKTCAGHGRDLRKDDRRRRRAGCHQHQDRAEGNEEAEDGPVDLDQVAAGTSPSPDYAVPRECEVDRCSDRGRHLRAGTAAFHATFAANSRGRRSRFYTSRCLPGTTVVIWPLLLDKNGGSVSALDAHASSGLLYAITRFR
jgi:hypothetical protein